MVNGTDVEASALSLAIPSSEIIRKKEGDRSPTSYTNGVAKGNSK